jgi:hypothetical protein
MKEKCSELEFDEVGGNPELATVSSSRSLEPGNAKENVLP